jgi:hypothetical protein
MCIQGLVHFGLIIFSTSLIWVKYNLFLVVLFFSFPLKVSHIFLFLLCVCDIKFCPGHCKSYICCRGCGYDYICQKSNFCST